MHGSSLSCSLSCSLCPWCWDDAPQRHEANGPIETVGGLGGGTAGLGRADPRHPPAVTGRVRLNRIPRKESPFAPARALPSFFRVFRQTWRIMKIFSAPPHPVSQSFHAETLMPFVPKVTLSHMPELRAYVVHRLTDARYRIPAVALTANSGRSPFRHRLCQYRQAFFPTLRREQVARIAPIRRALPHAHFLLA